MYLIVTKVADCEGIYLKANVFSLFWNVY